ncbi:MAG: hypothetical protein LBD14_00080 [Puniceicoccales bacterium]|jgi:hypothetical protein|nr:hypothetical protein [Puniceicoccales bacterium]
MQLIHQSDATGLPTMRKRILHTCRCLGLAIAMSPFSQLAANPDGMVAEAGIGGDVVSNNPREIVPESVRAAIVRVELHTQSADGDSPAAAGWSSRCPNCGEYHVNRISDMLEDHRPALVGGWLIAPDTVLVPDPCIASRFVREWRVSTAAGARATARLKAVAQDRRALLLQLDAPLAGTRPLQFAKNSSRQTRYRSIVHDNTGEGWNISIKPYAPSESLILRENGKAFLDAPQDALIIQPDGTPVTFTHGSGLLFENDAWRTPPEQWSWLDATAYAAQGKKIAAAAARTLLFAELRLRSNPVRPGENRDRDGERATDGPIPAIVLAPNRVLILAGLEPNVTARLEAITLRLDATRRINARFLGSLEKFDAFIVEPEQPLPVPAPLSAQAWNSDPDILYWDAHFRPRGKDSICHIQHLRFLQQTHGWLGLPNATFGVRAEKTHFIFDTTGALAALPIAPRKPQKGHWPRNEDAEYFPPSAFVSCATAAPEKWADPRNKPLNEKEENRIVWLGVETQPLDEKLAATLNVSPQTDKGSSGLLVNYIHPDSPAAKLGLQTGDVLLSILPEGESIDHKFIRDTDHSYYSGRFPWEHYDEMSDESFSRIPTPWQSADNTVNKLLKNIGLGKTCRLDYVRDSIPKNATFTIEPGPEHYLTVPEAKFEQYGFQVRELSFETRRYYQIPGPQRALIISHLTTGKPAAIAGLRPYELITEINGIPVTTAADFEKALNAAEKPRMQIRRMHQSRIITLDPQAKAPKKQPRPSSPPTPFIPDFD